MFRNPTLIIGLCVALIYTPRLLAQKPSADSIPVPRPSIPAPEITAPSIRVDGTLLDDLRPPSKPRLGLVVEELSLQLSKHLGISEGVYVASVEKDGPADKAGVQSGDIIVMVDDTKVNSIAELMAAVANVDGESLQLSLEGEKGRRTTEVIPIMVEPEPEPIRTMEYEELDRFENNDNRRPITGDIIRQLMNEFGQQLDGQTVEDLGGLARQLLGSGSSGDPMPRHLMVEIDRNKDGVAEIHVEVDNKTYKTDSNNLDVLPDGVREQVSGLVAGNGNRFNFGGIQIDWNRLPRRPQRSRDNDPPSLRPLPSIPGPVAIPSGKADPSEIEQLRQQMNELQKQLDRLTPDPREFD